MKKGLTEIVFILDKSGSMSGLEEDTIGGFNSMLEKQKKVEGSALITTVLFNHTYEMIHHRKSLDQVSPITEKEYQVGGSTALLDAIGISILSTKKNYIDTLEEERPEKVLFVITTDGIENASKEFQYQEIKSMIEHQKQAFDWEFLFLGANIDAESEARKFGINPDRVANYNHDRRGTKAHYDSVSDAVSSLRSEGTISAKWMEKVDKDFKTRK
ncbi:MAG: hypothetical protein KKE16_02545 [Firmicutes bacterium]|nr:hypothetical protein [Bacillota bacterium]